MAQDNISKFEELLRNDESLSAKLQELASAYEGDPADEESFFAATIGALAEEAGLPFSLEEAKGYVPNRELSDAELDAVAGGNPCFLFGGSDGAEAHCEGVFGSACAYLGVSFK